MMTPQQISLKAEALLWLGTPFREHTEICGVGADCVHLARGVLVGAGLPLPPIQLTNYPLDWAKHRAHSLVIEWIAATGCFRLLAAGAPMAPGDVLCVRQGRCSHHVAVLVGARHFIHTTPGRFAELGIVDDPAYSGRLEAVYRHRDAEGPAV